MKISTVPILVATLALCTGCNSLDNPLANLFHGHDSRVYNPQTGEWENSNNKATPQPQKSAAVASALSSTPPPQGSGHPPTAAVDPHNVSSASPSPGAPGSAGTPESPPAAPAAPAFTPAPPRPARATGFYNTTTGKIEWQNSGLTTAAATPPPAATKHWWWPF